MKTKIILPVCAAIAGLAGSAYASAISYTPADNLIVTGANDPVTVSANFVNASADDTDVLELIAAVGDTDLSPLDQFNTPLINNKTSGTGPVSLGNFSPGTELIFEEFVYSDSGHGNHEGTPLGNWYSGSYSGLNVDGFLHFDPTGTTTDIHGVPTTTVGVEDTGAGGDYDYNDIVFTFTGVSTPSTVPDVAGTMSLLGLGLTGLMAVGRRFRK